jgi:nucleoid-associated protein Lsr2
VLIDDLDGSEGAETVRLGWNGDWRELELSKKNLTALSRALDKYWNISRPVSDGRTRDRSRARKAPSPRPAKRVPKVIRSWATSNGIDVPARGRIPAHVERRYNEAHRRT